jgi:uncharacterized protein (DUF58 family)
VIGLSWLAVDIDPQPITNWFLLVLAIAGVVSLIAGIVVKVNRGFEKRVTDLIMEKTRSIQPDANGGLSMTDLHGKLDRLETRMEENDDKHTRQREEWHERYLEDQRRIRREWTAVFIAIRQMITKPIEEQAEMWDGITEDYINGTIGDKYPDERKTDG